MFAVLAPSVANRRISRWHARDLGQAMALEDGVQTAIGEIEVWVARQGERRPN
jgi:hypothetical protein